MALRGTSYTNHGHTGTIYPLSAFVREKVKPSGGELKLFHRTDIQWAEPGQFSPISTGKSHGLFQEGFYTSTRSEPYGPYEFGLTLPTKALANHKVLEVPYATVPGDFEMPSGVDVMAVKPPNREGVWFIFKPGSEVWVNGASTESDFDAPGEPRGP